MSSGNSLYGALSYNQIKVDEDHAKVVFTANMKDPEDGIYTMSVCLESFESRLMANQKTEKPVLHVSLNPDPKDVLSDEQLSKIAQEYMQKMGYGEQPYIVFKHEDIERHHLHIISLRVDKEGKKINDKFEHRRSMDICRELEQKYGLVFADQKKRQEGLPLKPVRYEDGDVKHQIANVIRPISQSWHFQSLKEYRALLTLYNISVEEIRGEIKGKEYKGLVYSALNDKGEKVGNPFKSSLFGKSVGIEALEKRIEKSAEVIKNKGLKERSKQVITAAMRTCNNRPNFEKALEKQGVSVLFRENEQGRIYGVTFIDHEQKAVFNGSRLGKEFSANVFNELFNGNGQTREQQPEQSEDRRAGQTFEPFTLSNREQDEGSGIGGLLDLFSPETAGDEITEQNFVRRLKKKQKRQRHI
ncbi:MAG: relaxase/mobilization nuclease domain-containing protein [Prevotellaceae bacterium]|nr:relaxase/mobilization nuclease domain-containing protein [Prevotellaceae bacterium]